MKETSNYVLTQDTGSIFERINNRPVSKQFLDTCDRYFTAIQYAAGKALPDVTVRGYAESEINETLSTEVREILRADERAYCICLDRFLLRNIENDFPKRFFRFSITRTADGNKVARAGDKTFEEQVRQFKLSFPTYLNDKGIIVDDGIFSGGTIKDTVSLFASYGVNLTNITTIGFIGSSEQPEQTRIVRPTENLYDWIDIRDFSPLGGKTKASSKSNRVASSIPYLFPWSFGEGASLSASPKLFEVSKRMIWEFNKLVQTFEETEFGRSITFRDLVKQGFPLPTGARLPVSINDRLSDYLNLCVSYIDYEENRRVFVFDMDGTIYQLDGKENEFNDSTLAKSVSSNALAFIKNNEACTESESQRIYDEGVADPIGLSQYLSTRYKISRQAYFDSVWNIDPEGKVFGFKTATQTIRKLKENPANKLILLTSAPRIWASRVLQVLNLENVFEIRFTGEQFGNKNEIFQRLAGWYKPINIWSIGDQLKTDIEPAKQYGIQTLCVRTPDDTAEIFQRI